MTGEVSLSRLCAAVRGKPMQGDLSRRFIGASLDSRTLERGAIFFAVRGKVTDGHRFLGAASRSGASAAVVERRVPVPRGFPVISVPSTVRALQRGSAWYRSRFSLPLVGVTGSNGKTTVKNLTAWVLEAALGRRVLATRGNLNNHLGVPLTLFRLNSRMRAAVVEMAMNRPGDIGMLAAMAAPSVGVVLNAGPAHMWRFRNVDGVAKEKARLLQALPEGGWAVLNAEDSRVWKTRRMTNARVLGFGLGRGEVRAEAMKMNRWGCASFKLCTPSGKAFVRLSLPGRHNALNAAAAAAVAWIMGAEPGCVGQALASFSQRMEMRMEKGSLRGGGAGVVDCYNANPASCRAAFSYLKDLGATRPVLVLAEMLELGRHSIREHRKVGKMAAGLGPALLVGVGRQAKEIVAAARRAGVREAHWVERVSAAYPFVRDAAGPGTIVLFKGSRKVGLELLVRKLGFRAGRLEGMAS